MTLELSYFRSFEEEKGGGEKKLKERAIFYSSVVKSYKIWSQMWTVQLQIYLEETCVSFRHGSVLV